ncbi:MAG: SDR family NAD(P)-dependent oxidoreductase [Acidimicrobiales bacterium]
MSSELPDAGDLLGLRGKTVLVTGGGRGIGRAVAEHFAGVGTNVGVVDLDGDTARAVADSLPAAVAVQCDVRDRSALEHAADAVEAELGPIDVWINNAGGVFPGAVAGLVDLERETWDRIFELNLTAVLFGCQIAARRMTDRSTAGSIVNISSFQGTNASPFMTPYGAAKAGLIQFSKSMALELAPKGIRVNVVAPSFVLTPAAEVEMSAERKAASVRAIPLARAGQPKDIAGIVLSLASNLAAFTTGQVIVVDGGLGLTNARPHRGQIG